MTRDNGGAFPTPSFNASPGMTLRDYFAAKAMAAILTGESTLDNTIHAVSVINDTSALAYQYADAMLAERAK